MDLGLFWIEGIGVCKMGTKADLFFLKELDTDNSISKLILSNNQLYNLHSFAWESVYLGKISLLKIACVK